MGTQLSAVAVHKFTLQRNRDHSVHPGDGQRVVGGNFADAARPGELGWSYKTRRPGSDALFPDAAEPVAIDARGVRHPRFVWKFRAAANGDGFVDRRGHRSDGHLGAARRGAFISQFAARSSAAGQSLYVAWPAFGGIFLFLGNRLEPGRRAHRLYRGILHGGQAHWRVGAAGFKLFRCCEHFLPVGRGRSHRTAGLNQRRIFVPVVRHPVCRTPDEIAGARGDSAGVFLGLST